jgi:hypothetical protein
MFLYQVIGHLIRININVYPKAIYSFYRSILFFILGWLLCPFMTRSLYSFACVLRLFSRLIRNKEASGSPPTLIVIYLCGRFVAPVPYIHACTQACETAVSLTVTVLHPVCLFLSPFLSSMAYSTPLPSYF